MSISKRAVSTIKGPPASFQSGPVWCALAVWLEQPQATSLMRCVLQCRRNRIALRLNWLQT